MTKEKLNQKEQHYAGNRDEAESIVTAAKDSIYLTMHKISEKHNKLGTYFLVDLTYSFNVPREIMECEADSGVEEESNHEGIEVKQNSDGGFEVDPNQISIDDVVEDVPEDKTTDVPF